MIRYSPAPPERYTVVEGRSGLGSAFAGPDLDRRAMWNLLYLSWPDLDLWLDADAAGPYRPDMVEAVAKTVFQDLGGRPLWEALLDLTPAAFSSLLEVSDYTHLDLYTLLGPQWIDTVALRAGRPQRQPKQERVVYVDFRNRH